MKLATLRTDGSTRAVVLDGDSLVDLGAPDLGAFLARPDWAQRAAAALEDPTATRFDATGDLAPLVPNPSKVVLVGLNYRTHIQEMGRDLPEYPTLFSKYAETLIGARDDIQRPAETEAFDWEVELAVVIGRGGRDIPEDQALERVFGYTIGNDVSVRDHQRSRHGGQWFKGKSFDTHCPLGPWVVTADEIPDPQVLDISSRINGVTKQASNTRHMVFSVARIISELSIGMGLWPGDVILTGTPEGVGFARKPPEFLKPGDVMEMEIEGIGTLRNTVVAYEEAAS